MVTRREPSLATTVVNRTSTDSSPLAGTLDCRWEGCVFSARTVATWVLVGILGVGLTGASVLNASVLEKLTLRGLQDRAEAVVTARVLSSHSVWTGQTIETETLVRVKKGWHGVERGRLAIRTPGGTIDSRRLLVPGAPEFTRNEEVILFLYRTSADHWRPVGLFQGVWRVDPERPARALASQAGGAGLVALELGPYAVDRGEFRVKQLVGLRESRQ